MHYRGIGDLNRDIVLWIDQLPKNIELFVGLPRAGLLVANLLSLYLDRPFVDLDGFLAGRIFKHGPRLSEVGLETRDFSGVNTMVVDDSLWSGTQMRKAQERIMIWKPLNSIIYGAVYISPGSENLVDYYYEKIPIPRIFEWNLMHHTYLSESCMDIDGILCRDPTKEENDDGPLYREFLNTVEPCVIPTKKIGWLVTCRLEKYRELTERWLKRNNVNYDKLIMLDLPSATERQRNDAYGKYKTMVYKHTNARLFIESCLHQAVEIAELSRRPVYCMATRQMIYPGVDPERIKQASLFYRIKWKTNDVRRKLGHNLKDIFGPQKH